jgi:hypothetical protein
MRVMVAVVVGEFVGSCVNTGMRVGVGVGDDVMRGVSVGIGVFVAGCGVKVGDAVRKAEVCMADQVFTAAVLGQPGSTGAALRLIPQAVETKKARMISAIRRR